MILRALCFLYFSLNWLMFHKSWERDFPKSVCCRTGHCWQSTAHWREGKRLISSGFQCNQNLMEVSVLPVVIRRPERPAEWRTLEVMLWKAMSLMNNSGSEPASFLCTQVPFVLSIHDWCWQATTGFTRKRALSAGVSKMMVHGKYPCPEYPVSQGRHREERKKGRLVLSYGQNGNLWSGIRKG